jgi:hypothetical protein
MTSAIRTEGRGSLVRGGTAPPREHSRSDGRGGEGRRRCRGRGCRAGAAGPRAEGTRQPRIRPGRSGRGREQRRGKPSRQRKREMRKEPTHETEGILRVEPPASPRCPWPLTRKGRASYIAHPEAPRFARESEMMPTRQVMPEAAGAREGRGR